MQRPACAIPGSPDLTPRLSTFSAATCHEAAGRRGALPSAVRPVWNGARLCGPAYPVHQTAAGDNTWIHRAVYAAPPGSVLVVATGHPEYGYWGELMTRAALRRGLAGLVIDGGVRDVDALQDLAFPAFASRVCVRGTTKDPTGAGALGESVALGDVWVHRGDVVVADRDGVVVLPANGLHEILARAAARARAEQEIRRALAAGHRLLDLVAPSGT